MRCSFWRQATSSVMGSKYGCKHYEKNFNWKDCDVLPSTMVLSSGSCRERRSFIITWNTIYRDVDVLLSIFSTKSLSTCRRECIQCLIYEALCVCCLIVCIINRELAFQKNSYLPSRCMGDSGIE